MVDNAEHVSKAIESLRRRLCNDEEAWRDLCVVMGALSPVAAGDPLADLAAQQEPGLPCSSEMMMEMLEPQGVVGDEMVERAARVVAIRAGEDFDRIGEFAQSILLETQRAALTAALHPPTREGQPDGR